MIYEILKAASDAGFGWDAYAVSVLVSAYLVYILCWIAGWVYCRSYEFIYDYEKTTDNPMNTFTERLRGEYDYKLGRRVNGFLFFPSWDKESVGIGLPGLLAIVFLVVDLVPAIGVGIALYYSVLVLARKAVRLASKFEQHIKDPNAHK